MNQLRYLAPPCPFEDVSKSTSKHLSERISFVDSIITHPHFKGSETQAEAFLDYQDACQTLKSLADPSENKEEREAAQTCIRDFEKSLENNNEPAKLSFDLGTKTKLGEELDNLWNMWSFSRYENFLPEGVAEEAKDHPSAQVPDPWHKRFWKPFNGRLEAEADAFSKVLAGENRYNECPTFLLLALVVERHTVNWDESLELIKACATDGDDVQPPKADLVELLKARDVSGLATRLDRDEASISLSAEYVMGVGSMILAFYSSHLPEVLFDREEFDAAQWQPTQALEDLLELKEGHEEALRKMLHEMFEKMVTEDSEEDDDDDDEAYEGFVGSDIDDDDGDEAAWSDESEDY
ncbi:hypothetical protein BBP40_010928 [Aspergillus hancockii]|nr:hypothetical protein BBP40_010928 [Aspergillus hancockii]